MEFPSEEELAEPVGRDSARIWGCVTFFVALIGGSWACGGATILTLTLFDATPYPIQDDKLVSVALVGFFGAGLCLHMGLSAVRIFFPDQIGPRLRRWSGLSFYFASLVFLLLALSTTIGVLVVEDVEWSQAEAVPWMYLLSFAAFKLGKKYRKPGE